MIFLLCVFYDFIAAHRRASLVGKVMSALFGHERHKAMDNMLGFVAENRQH